MSIKDMPPTTNCENCGVLDIHRIFSPAEIHWHHTDKEVRIPSKPTKVYIRKDK
jgi:hypothetical protein